jgi:hypothetical protein
MIAPTLFRLAAFVSMTPRLNTPMKVVYAGAWTMAAGFPQDLFIALQCLLIVVILNALLWRAAENRRQRVVTVFTTLLFAVVQLYLLFDFFLYWKTGLRMDCALLGFLPAASSFTSSAYEMGLGGLAVGLIVLGAAVFFTYQVFARTVASLRFSVGLAAGLPLLGLVA